MSESTNKSKMSSLLTESHYKFQYIERVSFGKLGSRGPKVGSRGHCFLLERVESIRRNPPRGLINFHHSRDILKHVDVTEKLNYTI